MLESENQGIGYSENNYTPEVPTEGIDFEVDENKRQVFLERERLAIELGNGYSRLLDILLSDSYDKKEQCLRLVDNIPQSAKDLLRNGIDHIYEQMNINENLLQQHENDKAEFLFNYVLADHDIEEDKIPKIKNLVSQSQYFEPTPGIPIIAMDCRILREIFYALGEQVPPGQDINFCAHGVETNEPSFIVVSKHTGEEYQIGKDSRQYDDLKHELNHFVWSQVEKSGFARSATGDNINEISAFGHFRSEAVAYLMMEDREIFDKTSPQHLTQSDDETILEKAELLQTIISSMSQKLETVAKTSKNCLIYYIFSARNFDECLERLIKLKQELDQLISPIY